MKILKILVAFLMLFIITTGVAHAFIFPQQTRCILIDFYDFEQADNLYYSSNLDEKTKIELQEIIKNAEAKVAEFWGEKRVSPKYIYCENEEDYRKFGLSVMTPAVAHMKLGAYVVISKNGVDENIIAHEISHTELYERIGFFNRELKIPTWFDEGLAMQVDDRSYYSIEDLKEKSNNFKNLPDVKAMQSFIEFGKGTRAAIMLNYSTSKYEVYNWYTAEKLEKFIFDINNGADFESAFYGK